MTEQMGFVFFPKFYCDFTQFLQKKTEALTEGNKNADLEVNTKKNKYRVILNYCRVFSGL
jgi:hypothetical protein